MSKTSRTPNTPDPTREELESKIQELVEGLKERVGKLIDFAQNPTDFVNSPATPAEIQFITAQVIGRIANEKIEQSIASNKRADRTTAERLIAPLLDGILELDRPELSEESKRQLVETLITLGQHASLVYRNKLAEYFADMFTQLIPKDRIAVIEFIGDTFRELPYGNKRGTSWAFDRYINGLRNGAIALTRQEQQALTDTFGSILENGHPFELNRALAEIDILLKATPISLDENLRLIFFSLRDSNEEHVEFHRVVARFSGMIAKNVKDFSADLSEDELQARLKSVEAIFTLLAIDPDVEVRKDLVENIGTALKHLAGFDHDIDKVVHILRNDSDPVVKASFDRQVSREFLLPAATDTGLER